MHHRPLRSAVTVLLLAMAGFIASPAFAEGSFSSYFRGWLPGTSSRTWSDQNRDADATRITLGGCHAVSSGAVPITPQLQLTRETPWYLPDDNRGRKSFECWSQPSVTQSWGRQPSGTYHFTLTKVNGSDVAVDKISAPTVRVGW